jgi:phosphoglucosamine mutase
VSRGRSPATGRAPWSAATPAASGEFLSAAVIAGLASAGVDVEDAGVLPTPAVAALVKRPTRTSA